MPRSNRPRRAPKRTEQESTVGKHVLYGNRTTVVKRGIEYTVQSHSGSADDDNKSWACPHCNIRIERGTPHIVAWDERGSQVRRHFHTECWKKWQGQVL